MEKVNPWPPGGKGRDGNSGGRCTAFVFQSGGLYAKATRRDGELFPSRRADSIAYLRLGEDHQARGALTAQACHCPTQFRDDGACIGSLTVGQR